MKTKIIIEYMDSLDKFSKLRHFIATQPFDKDLVKYKNTKYPIDKIKSHKGVGPYFYYILDWQSGKYPFISEGWRNFLDYDNNFWDRGLEAVLSVIHPDDALNVQKIILKWIQFMLSKSEKDLNEHSINFDYRAIRKNGTVFNIIQQSIYTSFDSKGNILYDLGMVMDITHYKNDSDISLQILGPEGEKVLDYYPAKETNQESAFIRKNLEDFSYVNPDNSFLKHVQDIIFNNMKNEQFGVEDLSRELALSRTQLYRSIVALVGMPPNQLIQKHRLNEAYKLIKNTSDTISEIAFKVGFSSPSYFIKVFKDEFNITPSKLRKKPSHTPQTMYFLH